MDMTDNEKYQEWTTAPMMDPPRMPLFLPELIRLLKTVRGECFWKDPVVARPGVYIADTNPWGAVSVKTDKGELLGIKPNECEVIEWIGNPYLSPGVVGS